MIFSRHNYKAIALIILLIMILSACATPASLDKSRDSMLSTLKNKKICCSEISQLRFKKIKNLPFTNSNWSLSSHELITDESDAYVFSGFKSYVAAYELPEVGKKRIFKVNSRQITDLLGAYRGGFFVPVIRVYDPMFSEVLVYSEFKFNAEEDRAFQAPGLQGEVIIPENARYVVIHTTAEGINRYTTFGLTGSRSCNAPNGIPNCGNRVHIPGIPEGALLLNIDLLVRE